MKLSRNNKTPGILKLLLLIAGLGILSLAVMAIENQPSQAAAAAADYAAPSTTYQLLITRTATDTPTATRQPDLDATQQIVNAAKIQATQLQATTQAAEIQGQKTQQAGHTATMQSFEVQKAANTATADAAAWNEYSSKETQRVRATDQYIEHQADLLEIEEEDAAIMKMGARILILGSGTILAGVIILFFTVRLFKPEQPTATAAAPEQSTADQDDGLLKLVIMKNGGSQQYIPRSESGALLQIDPHHFAAWCRAALDDKSLAFSEWGAAGKRWSRPQYEEIRRSLIRGGIAYPEQSGVAFKLKPEGQDAIREWLKTYYKRNEQ